MPELEVIENKRLESLYSYEILDTEEETEFDNLVKLAAHICEVPIAKLNFLDKTRQWSKANYGNDVKEVPREVSFCHHTIKNKDYMVVEDISKDERFQDLEFVVNEPKLRFYAGFNIKGQGQNIGTICVLGSEPKQLSKTQLEALATLANEVGARLELKKKNKELATLTAFLEASVEMLMVVDPDDLSIIKINENGSTLYQELFPEGIKDSLNKQFPEWEYLKVLKDWAENGDEQALKYETSLKNNKGEQVFLEINTTKKYGKWLITFRNITKKKIAEKHLQREKKLSDAIINALPIDFYMFDEHLNLLRWNENMTKNTGYSDEEIVEMNPLDFFKGKDIERIKEHLNKTFNGFKSNLEANLVKKSGEEEPFLFNAVTFEINNNKYLLGTGQSISHQKEYQHKLEDLLKEKEVLLSEVHHRVKNNLAVISGFLQLEELISEDEKIKSVLVANYLRVKSMALIHEELYTAKNFTGLNFRHYLQRLLNVLEEKMSPSHKEIELEVNVDPVFMNLNQAVPLALIVNELVSNAYEFAFTDKDQGSILVELKSEGDEITLRIKDDGIGLPEEFVLEESPTLGATLVLSYSEQINSKIDVITGNGTVYELRFLNKKNSKGSSANVNLGG